MSTRELVAGALQSARFALQHDSTFGQVMDVRLPHRQRPNGCPARLRIAVTPDRVVCRVFNSGGNHGIFREATAPIFAFTNSEMKGWTAQPGSSRGPEKVFWEEVSYRPPRLNPTNINYADLLQAVSSARDACGHSVRFRTRGANRWQSADTDNGVYPVEWTVEARGTVVEIRLKNKGPRSEALGAFGAVARWAFGYVKRHNPDARDLNAQPRGVFMTLADTLRLEVPSGPTF